MERLLTPMETGNLLGFDVQTIYRLVRIGEMNAVKLGRRSLRISEGEIKRFIDNKNEIASSARQGARG
jgi:excisionase family DNA binding protein